MTPAEGIVPLIVTFTNQSTGDIASYAWDFNGDGITDSTDANPPAYTYAAPGIYTVTLVVTGLSGSSVQATQFISVTAPQPPVEPVPESTAAPVTE